MALRIDPDHRRFRDIVRGKIKQDLRKYISQGELIGRKGKDMVSIPLPLVKLVCDVSCGVHFAVLSFVPLNSSENVQIQAVPSGLVGKPAGR